MPKSFIKIKPITASSEKHNTRQIEPKYLIEPSNKNVSIGTPIKEKLAELKKLIKEKTGRTMQKKATPIREAVVLLPDDNNDINLMALEQLSKALEEQYNIKTFQTHIHNDEGHINEKGEKKYNYHAHLVFDWIDHSTGKSLKLDKEDMSNIQTLTAQALEMERGVKGSKSLSLNHHEYRGFLTIKDDLEKELKMQISKETERKIREELVQKREQEKALKQQEKEKNYDENKRRVSTRFRR